MVKIINETEEGYVTPEVIKITSRTEEGYVTLEMIKIITRTDEGYVTTEIIIIRTGTELVAINDLRERNHLIFGEKIIIIN